MSSASPEQGRRRSSGRSPNYPGVSLRKAVERAGLLLKQENRYWANIATVAKHLGFSSPNTGPATITYASLKKFGLLEERGSGSDREARVSDLGYKILKAPPAQRAAAVKEAAMLPAVHQEMWKRFPDGLPSEENLLWRLEEELGFTRNGALDFVRKYRETMVFAGFDTTATFSSEDELADEGGWAYDDGEDGGDEAAPKAEPPVPKRQERPVNPDALSIPVPVIGGPPVVVEGVFPISPAAWDQFMSVLQAMKPALVTEHLQGASAGQQAEMETEAGGASL